MSARDANGHLELGEPATRRQRQGEQQPDGVAAIAARSLSAAAAARAPISAARATSRRKCTFSTDASVLATSRCPSGRRAPRRRRRCRGLRPPLAEHRANGVELARPPSARMSMRSRALSAFLADGGSSASMGGRGGRRQRPDAGSARARRRACSRAPGSRSPLRPRGRARTRRVRRRSRVAALREQRRGDAAEHVARAAGREHGRALGDDVTVAVGPATIVGTPLSSTAAPVSRRERGRQRRIAPRAPHSTSIPASRANSAGCGVRSAARSPSSGASASAVAGEGVERVGVEHDRPLDSRSSRSTIARASPSPEPRTDQHHVGPVARARSTPLVRRPRGGERGGLGSPAPPAASRRHDALHHARRRCAAQRARRARRARHARARRR